MAKDKKTVAEDSKENPSEATAETIPVTLDSVESQLEALTNRVTKLEELPPRMVKVENDQATMWGKIREHTANWKRTVRKYFGDRDAPGGTIVALLVATTLLLASTVRAGPARMVWGENNNTTIGDYGFWTGDAGSCTLRVDHIQCDDITSGTNSGNPSVSDAQSVACQTTLVMDYTNTTAAMIGKMVMRSENSQTNMSANDYMQFVSLQATNSGGGSTTARIDYVLSESKATDTVGGSEDSTYTLKTYEAGSQVNSMVLGASAATFRGTLSASVNDASTFNSNVNGTVVCSNFVQGGTAVFKAGAIAVAAVSGLGTSTQTMQTAITTAQGDITTLQTATNVTQGQVTKATADIVALTTGAWNTVVLDQAAQPTSTWIKAVADISALPTNNWTVSTGWASNFITSTDSKFVGGQVSNVNCILTVSNVTMVEGGHFYGPTGVINDQYIAQGVRQKRLVASGNGLANGNEKILGRLSMNCTLVSADIVSSVATANLGVSTNYVFRLFDKATGTAISEPMSTHSNALTAYGVTAFSVTNNVGTYNSVITCTVATNDTPTSLTTADYQIELIYQ